MQDVAARFGGRYRFVCELGSGGMGHVYQAVDTRTGQSVAVKVMIAGRDHDLQWVLRFYQEAAVLAGLKHPNIVEVHGTMMEGEASCIVMELLEGRSLGQILASEGLSLVRTQALVLQVAAALSYAHQRGVVHRDIKPDNIMVVGDDRVKVTDFGVARVSGAGITMTPGHAIGTPHYMSPEQITGRKVDGRSDIYSLGAVMYQMVTGRPPFEGTDPLTIAFQHVHRAPSPPSGSMPQLPADWEEVILTMLAKDPGDRFQTAGSLEQAIGGLTVPGGTRPGRVRPVSERRRASRKEAARADLEAAGQHRDPGAPSGGRAEAVALHPSTGPAAGPSWRGLNRRAVTLGAAGLTAAILIGAVLLFRPSSAPRHPAAHSGGPTVRLLATWRLAAGGHLLFDRPEDVKVSRGGTVYVADYRGDRIAVLSPAGRLVRTVGSPGDAPGQLRGPSGVDVDSQGNVYVADSLNSRVQKLSPDGRPLAAWGRQGPAVERLNGPHDVAVDAGGNVFVTDFYNNRVVELSPEGKVLAHWGSFGHSPGQLDGPTDLALDGKGNVYVSDFSNNRVEEFTPTGRLLATWDGERMGFIHPHGLAVDTRGNIYVTDYANNRVLQVSPMGRVLERWGTTGHGPMQFDRPSSVDVDSRGNVYVADSGSGRVRKFSIG